MVQLKSKTVRKEQDFKLEFEQLKKAALKLRAMNHDVRQKILSLIHKNEEITVSEIYSKLKIEQSLTSTHLAILRKAGIVKTRREAQSIYYSINYDQVSIIQKGAVIING